MYNNFMLVGKIKSFWKSSLEIEVLRDFKNANGEYESDVLRVWFNDYFADILDEHLKEGTKIGIKGRIVKTSNNIELRGEKIVFF